MKRNKLEELVKKFEEGTISSTEEKELRDYLAQHKVPPNFRQYQEKFQSSEQNQKTNYLKASGKKFYVWGGVMLVIILALGVFFFQQKNLNSIQSQELGTIHDEELALEKTKETLQMVSVLMNEGKKDLVYLKEFNNTREKIIKHEN